MYNQKKKNWYFVQFNPIFQKYFNKIIADGTLFTIFISIRDLRILSLSCSLPLFLSFYRLESFLYTLCFHIVFNFCILLTVFLLTFNL